MEPTTDKRQLDVNSETDMKELFNSMVPLAEEGHSFAQNALGVCYYNGTGVDQNFSMALKWYNLAAEQGEVRAQACLAGMYETATGTDEDLENEVKPEIPSAIGEILERCLDEDPACRPENVKILLGEILEANDGLAANG